MIEILVTPTGSETSGSLEDALADEINVRFFGAKGDGVADDAPAIQAAIDAVDPGASVLIQIPPGIYLLNSNVIPNGRIVSIQVDPAATFTGVGTLKLFNTPNYGDKGQKNPYVAVLRGSASAPISEPSALLSAVKYSNAGETSGRDPAAHFGVYKHSTAAGSRVEAVYAEAVDTAGVDGFVEGGRFNALINTGASGGSGAFGVLATAGCQTGIAFHRLHGCEASTINKTADAPNVDAFDQTNTSAAFVASNAFSTFVCDAGLLINPFNEASGAGFRTGVLVPDGSVIENAFACTDSVTYGLNMRHGTYSGAVLLAPNKSAIIRARNGADTANHNLFSYAMDDVLAVGTDARQTNLKVVDSSMANPVMRAVRYGAADSAAPGFRQLMVLN